MNHVRRESWRTSYDGDVWMIVSVVKDSSFGTMLANSSLHSGVEPIFPSIFRERSGEWTHARNLDRSTAVLEMDKSCRLRKPETRIMSVVNWTWMERRVVSESMSARARRVCASESTKDPGRSSFWRCGRRPTRVRKGVKCVRYIMLRCVSIGEWLDMVFTSMLTAVIWLGIGSFGGCIKARDRSRSVGDSNKERYVLEGSTI